MKRSEMIKKLSAIMICPHTVIEPGIDLAFEWKAKRVLDFIEELGMLPPIILYKPKEENTSHAHYYPNGFPTNRWEDEE